MAYYLDSSVQFRRAISEADAERDALVQRILCFVATGLWCGGLARSQDSGHWRLLDHCVVCSGLGGRHMGSNETLGALYSCKGIMDTWRHRVGGAFLPGIDRAIIVRWISRMSPNKALHRTAICAWGFALELLVFICQLMAVGELGR